MAETRKTTKQYVAELNKWLKIFTQDSGKTENKVLHLRHKTEMTKFYALRRKLMALGRVNSKKIVLNTRPVTEKEFNALGGAYGQNVERLMANSEGQPKLKKQAPNGTGKPALRDPISVPVLEHPSGARITIDINVEELVRVSLKLIREGGVR